MSNPNASQVNTSTGWDQTESQCFPNTVIKSARFDALFWNNALNNTAGFMCPYVSKNEVEKDS